MMDIIIYSGRENLILNQYSTKLLKMKLLLLQLEMVKFQKKNKLLKRKKEK